MHFQNNYAYVEKRSDYSANTVTLDSEARYFNASITVRVPVQEVL